MRTFKVKCLAACGQEYIQRSHDIPPCCGGCGSGLVEVWERVVRRAQQHCDDCGETWVAEDNDHACNYCSDCGEPGVETGHQDCQYPEDHP